MFAMTLEKLRVFLTILLISGYAGLPRQEMQLKKPEDCHNLLASVMMTETECKQYLHLAVNSSDRFAKVQPLFNAINEQCILNYQPSQHVSFVSYVGKHGANEYIHCKPIKFWFKLQVMATPSGNCIQFCPCSCRDSILHEYEKIGLGLGASVFANLVNKLCQHTSNYYIVMDNYFTSPALLRHLSAMGVAATDNESKPNGKWKMLCCKIW